MFILIVLMSFASAGLFSDIFGKITGGVTYSDCILDNPKDLAGNRILVSEHYFGAGNYENYAGKYCEIVWGCTGFKDVTIADDSVKACRCDTNSFGCEGGSCVNDVSTTTYWERVASVTCTGCPTDCSGEKGVAPVCGDGNIDAGEECDDGNIFSGDGCSSSCAIEAAPSQTCLDSDVDAIQYPHGKNYYKKGFYSGYGDFCSLNIGEENILLEYYCSYDASGNPVKNYTQYNCSTEGMVCVEGVCIPELKECINHTDCEGELGYYCEEGFCAEFPFEASVCELGGDSCEFDICSSGKELTTDSCAVGGFGLNYVCCKEDVLITECTDSDGDLSLDEQYYVQGTTSLKNSSSEDTCDGEEIVQEFYCFEDGINNGYYKCPNGCEGGACIEIPIEGECTMGCYLDEKCYNIGVRKSGDYCGEDLDFEKQKEPDASCGDNFECLSNICIDGACIQASLWKRFLALIRGEISWSDIFPGGDDKNLVADDLVLTFETGDEYALILLDYGEENLDETDEYSTGFFLDLEDGYGFSEILKTVLRDSLPLEGLLLQISGVDSHDVRYTIRAIIDTKEEIKESDEEDNCIQKTFTIVRDDTGNVTGFNSEGLESCEEDKPISVDLKINTDDFPEPVLYQSTLDVSWESEGDVIRCNGFGHWVPTADEQDVWGKLGGDLDPSRDIALMAAFAIEGDLTQITYLTNLTIGIQCWDSSNEFSVTDEVSILVYEERQICTDTDPTDSDVIGQYPYGKNIYVGGSTIIGENTRPDECYDGFKVIESYCLDESTGNTEIIDCPNGFVCEAGVCKSQIVPKEFIAVE